MCLQEGVGIGADGLEETVASLEHNSLFGEISILCNIPQPYTVRVCELCRLLRIDKQSFSNILEIYFHDGRKVLTNLLEVTNKFYQYHCNIKIAQHYLKLVQSMQISNKFVQISNFDREMNLIYG